MLRLPVGVRPARFLPVVQPPRLELGLVASIAELFCSLSETAGPKRSATLSTGLVRAAIGAVGRAKGDTFHQGSSLCGCRGVRCGAR